MLKNTVYDPLVVYLCSDILQTKQLNQLCTVRKYSVGSLCVKGLLRDLIYTKLIVGINRTIRRVNANRPIGRENAIRPSIQ